MQGWIKLHRTLQCWEWKNSPKHVAVFIDILLNVNHKDKSYRGILIPAGSMTTSYDAMSKRTGVSIRGLRTVLKDLKTTGEVTHVATSKYSMISVTNWDEYQASDTPDDKQATSKRQASDKQTTTNKNVKNVNNVNNNINSEKMFPPDHLIDAWNDICPERGFPYAKSFSRLDIDNIIESQEILPELEDWKTYFTRMSLTPFFLEKLKIGINHFVKPETVSRFINSPDNFGMEEL